jgi:replicative DNA helicase
MNAPSFDDTGTYPPPPEPDLHHTNHTTPHLPYDNHAEQSLLGAMLLNPNVIADVATTLHADDFHQPAHQHIYNAILTLWGNGGTIDPVIVAGHLDKHNNLTRVGGAPYLHTLIAGVPTTTHATHYAEIVTEKATLRRLITTSQTITHNGFNPDGQDAATIVDAAQEALNNVNRTHTTQEYASLFQCLQSAVDELDAIASHGGLTQGVPTGFHDLDTLTNGLHGGQMIIVAARPGVGKSTLALDFMRSCSIKHGKTSAVFSLEMSRNEIIHRLLSAETSIKLTDMRGGKLDDNDWISLTNHIERIQDAPIYIDDSANLTILDIKSKARQIHQQHGLDLLVVDYLQLMSGGKRAENRQQEVSEISRQLKVLAKELDVPVVAISQLNRGPEQRTDKRPQISDLRESGSLEQDADIVLLLYRPDSQDRDDPRAGEADIIVAKHRGGPIDTVKVAHQLHYSRFVSMPRFT